MVVVKKEVATPSISKQPSYLWTALAVLMSGFRIFHTSAIPKPSLFMLCRRGLNYSSICLLLTTL
jgi:hypothetical protein